MSVPDDRDAAFERGLKRRREILGDEWVDRALASRTPFNADLQSRITRFGVPAAHTAFHRAEAIMARGTTL
jgi:hypothetical protein